MKRQFYLFITALTFYTRIPNIYRTPYQEEFLNASTRYFPLIGSIVGLLSFLGFYIGNILFDENIAIIISLAVGILTTGAFHEDGFADFFDGFGGGWTNSKILEIMKDSRIGTYGMVSTFILLVLKFFSLRYIVTQHPFSTNTLYILYTFLIYHTLSRSTAIQLAFTIPYVREDALSKVKPIAKKFKKKDIAICTLFGLITLTLLCTIHIAAITILIPLILLIIYFKKYLLKWIGGYTGDCLGAVEQIAEVVILLSIIAIWKFL